MLAARSALLLALRHGPGYGRQLMRRLRAATGGRASLAPGSVYPALRALQEARLVRRWTVVAGKIRGGRARHYYELTVAGVRAAESAASALAGIALSGRPAPRVSPPEQDAMRSRIERVAELHAFATRMQESIPRAGRG
jgi:DNA-binding PadR family transcriptional regulator